ncbi:MAG TPA: hypothetical protein VG057_00610 [Solirubrobacteraceae bacterium]|jgi:hypothetical protein|nr:hypothetical protein [Solirubrobacteraceae bacterium]
MTRSADLRETELALFEETLVGLGRMFGMTGTSSFFTAGSTVPTSSHGLSFGPRLQGLSRSSTGVTSQRVALHGSE